VAYILSPEVYQVSVSPLCSTIDISILITVLNLKCLHPVACVRTRRGWFFLLRNVTIVGRFYYVLLLKLIHVSSRRNIFARIYSTDNRSVVFRI
jgi:hypothetical protein